MAATSILNIACGSETIVEYQHDVLRELLELVGADVGTYCVGQGGAPARVGPEELTSASERARYAHELGPVLREAHCHGVAVDAIVLGRAKMLRSSYHSEFVRPRGGGETLFACPTARGRPTSWILLGRFGTRGRFGSRAVARMSELLPELAIAALAVDSFETARKPRTSRREIEIVEYLALGYRSAEIAQALGTSVNTVRNQVSRLMTRLGASTRAEVVGIVRGRVS